MEAVASACAWLPLTSIVADWTETLSVLSMPTVRIAAFTFRFLQGSSRWIARSSAFAAFACGTTQKPVAINDAANDRGRIFMASNILRLAHC